MLVDKLLPVLCKDLFDETAVTFLLKKILIS